MDGDCRRHANDPPAQRPGHRTRRGHLSIVFIRSAVRNRNPDPRTWSARVADFGRARSGPGPRCVSTGGRGGDDGAGAFTTAFAVPRVWDDVPPVRDHRARSVVGWDL